MCATRVVWRVTGTHQQLSDGDEGRSRRPTSFMSVMSRHTWTCTPHCQGCFPYNILHPQPSASTVREMTRNHVEQRYVSVSNTSRHIGENCVTPTLLFSPLVVSSSQTPSPSRTHVREACGRGCPTHMLRSSNSNESSHGIWLHVPPNEDAFCLMPCLGVQQ